MEAWVGEAVAAIAEGPLLLIGDSGHRGICVSGCPGGKVALVRLPRCCDEQKENSAQETAGEEMVASHWLEESPGWAGPWILNS